jgi:hypothetical protein
MKHFNFRGFLTKSAPGVRLGHLVAGKSTIAYSCTKIHGTLGRLEAVLKIYAPESPLLYYFARNWEIPHQGDRQREDLARAVFQSQRSRTDPLRKASLTNLIEIVSLCPF